MINGNIRATVDAVRAAAIPLANDSTNYDALLELIGDARFVLIGEASHGTHEFYVERARITQRLIRERGFSAVAVEADWPHAYRVNCFVQGAEDDPSPEQALGEFTRFPRWMWRNRVVRDFAAWLREHNAGLSASWPVGFYGLDLYSLYSSINEVIRYLEHTDPEAARRARGRYGCFEHFGQDPQLYGYATSVGAESCEDDVVGQLLDLQHRAANIHHQNGSMAEDAHFYAEQNARLVRNAERYYRAMFRGRASSWNMRDQHMAETLDALAAHLSRHGERAKLVVWAHNSHLGDARATEMGDRGELNLGQLARERYGTDAVLVGFSTHTGTVTAAPDWDEPAERKRVRPSLDGSYEQLFHSTGLPRFMLPLRGPAADALRSRRLQRAIGVIYRPDTERMSHYFYTSLPEQFDALIHIDETNALEPLDGDSGREVGELPETFPTAL